jgi:hypothetical protein
LASVAKLHSAVCVQPLFDLSALLKGRRTGTQCDALSKGKTNRERLHTNCRQQFDNTGQSGTWFQITKLKERKTPQGNFFQ